MNITVILPVSRAKYLDRVFESLKNQTYKADSLLVLFDGTDREFVEVRNRVAETEFNSKLCVKSNNIAVGRNVPDRRRNISNNHNQIKELVGDADWLFSIEDDGILPADALERLVSVVESKPDVGMVSGVELGRWGNPYVGAWVVDNPDEVKKIASIPNKTGSSDIDKIDASGLYCALIRADMYKKHTFFSNNGLGPDVNLGIFLRQQGFMNYIDWSIPVTHLTNMSGLEMEIYPTDTANEVELTHLSGSVWQLSS